MSIWQQQIEALVTARRVPSAPGARKAFEEGQANRQEILDAVRAGKKNITEVCGVVSLSRETIGKAFRSLHADGKIRKVAYAHWEATEAAGPIEEARTGGSPTRGRKIARRGQSAPARHG
jgi:hypothetical protein